MKKEEFESSIQNLVGEIIQRVSYFEIAYENGKEYWNSEPEFDSLDYGLDLKMGSGVTKGIMWGGEFYQYGISLVPASLDSQLKGNRKLDVSTVSRWQELIGSRIKSAKVVWPWVKEHGLLKEKFYYPQDLILTFLGGKKVYISALEIRENKPCGLADNITVFFDKTIASKYGVEA